MSPQSNRAALPLSGQENAGWPDGSTGDSERPEGGSASGAMVVPLARSLAILTAFSPHEPWLGNQEIVIETGIPAPTVSRMARSLVTLGYLHYSPQRRKYRLAAPVLSLGYAAIAHSNVQLLARLEMQAFANANETYVMLGTRDRLDVIVLETCASKQASIDLAVCGHAAAHRVVADGLGIAGRAAGARALLPAGQHRTQDGPGVAEPAPPHQ